jgi:hypothetical protein
MNTHKGGLRVALLQGCDDRLGALLKMPEIVKELAVKAIRTPRGAIGYGWVR